MILSSPIKTLLTVRSASPADHQELAHLFHFETYVHRHLDWRSPLDWIDHPPFLIAEQRETLVGALSCPVDLPGLAWIQVFAAKSRFSLEVVWNSLWKDVLSFYQDQKMVTLAAIPSQPWFSRLLLSSQFNHSHNVVVLIWENCPLPLRDEAPGLQLRSMGLEDLPAVLKVDQASFELLWQQSSSSLEFAMGQACIATVAEVEGQIIGYQISTCGHLGGHLARLAVHPTHRGEHIGRALVINVLEQFQRRGILRVTVNTQQDNKISLNLYETLGFRKTGESFNVFTLSPYSFGKAWN